MKRRQKFMPLALALAMALSLAVPAFAAEITAPGGGRSEGVLTQEQTSFSVTVPTGLPVDIASDGTITVATDAEIRNNEFGPVEVTAVSVEPQNGWKLADFNTDFSVKKVGLHEFGFQLQGNNVGTDGSCSVEGFPVIPGNSAVPLSYDANVAAQKNAASNEVMANVVFTINWAAASDPAATPTAISIAANPSKTQYEVGENFDPTGMQIQVTFQDGHTETISAGFAVTDGSDLQAGRTSVTVSYTGAGVTQTCTVSISMAKGYDIVDPVNPGADSFELNIGETLQLNAVATFDMAPASWVSNNTSVATVSDTGLVTGVGEGVATITYTRGDMSSTTEITVRDPAKTMTGISVATNPTKTAYMVGEDFSHIGMTLLVSYADGHSKEISAGFTVADGTNLQAGRTSVTISYTENGISKTCNVPISVGPVYTDFTVTSSNRSKIGYTGAAGENLVIPATFKGTDGINYKVVAIGNRAFYDCSNLTNVTIPDSVTSIGRYAFYSCTSLTNVTIPDSVTSIGNDAFNYCYKLASVTIPNSVTSIGDRAFHSCSGLTSVTIPDSVTSIGILAFKCPSLKEINVNENNPNYCSVDGVLFNKDKTTLICYPNEKTGSYEIPNGVTRIEEYAFYYCRHNLSSVTIPDSVMSIGGYAFSDCSNLKEVNVDENNPNYCSVDGVLFNKDKTTLVYCPGGRTSSGYEIPNGVTSIGDWAFYSCYNLTNVTIPNSVKNIGRDAFLGVSHITYHGTATGAPWGASSMN